MRRGGGHIPLTLTLLHRNLKWAVEGHLDPLVLNVAVKSFYGPGGEKTCLRWFVNNKDADQPGHLCSLISAFVICLLESIIPRLATSEISYF